MAHSIDFDYLIDCPGCGRSMPDVNRAYERWQPCPGCGLPAHLLRLMAGWRQIDEQLNPRFETRIVTGDIGRMRVALDQETPAVVVHLAPEPTDQEMEITLSPSEARLWAQQLGEMATLAQRAGWTDEVVEYVRGSHMPGYAPGRVIEALDAVTALLGASPLDRGGEISAAASRVLDAIRTDR